MTIDPFSTDPEQRLALDRSARTALATRRWLEAAPARYRNANLAAVLGAHGDKVSTPLREWADSPTGALVLVGPPGVGKTYAAWAALRQVCWRGLVLGGNFATILDALRPGSDDDRNSTQRAAWHRCLCASGLLLDDVGAEKQTEWAAEKLDTLVDMRWASALPTIVTSNFPPEMLASHVGDRAWSRLTGTGSLVMRLTGPDLRRTYG